MNKSNIGYIDSLETMGLLDGPGIRFIVFLKGCKLRCAYCHNPETWNKNNALQMTSDELISRIHKYKNYYKGGGVTFSGGEPLLQPEFLIDMLKKCHSINLHTAIDTSGVGLGRYEEILQNTDLVLLDVKALTEEKYIQITGQPMTEFNKFLEVLNKTNAKVWIRQVIIPGINDTEEYIFEFKKYLKNINNIERIDLLPYHNLAINKYKKLGIEYALKDTKSMSKLKIEQLKKLLEE